MNRTVVPQGVCCPGGAFRRSTSRPSRGISKVDQPFSSRPELLQRTRRSRRCWAPSPVPLARGDGSLYDASVPAGAKPWCCSAWPGPPRPGFLGLSCGRLEAAARGRNNMKAITGILVILLAALPGLHKNLPRRRGPRARPPTTTRSRSARNGNTRSTPAQGRSSRLLTRSPRSRGSTASRWLCWKRRSMGRSRPRNMSASNLAESSGIDSTGLRSRRRCVS